MFTTIDFRGEERDVEVTKYADEPDTNSCAIEWNFVDDEFKDAELTDEEEESIHIQLAEIMCDRHWDDTI